MKKVSIGGQAVIGGVMMKGSECIATAVRKPSGEIVYKKTKLIDKDRNFLKKPFIRGVIMLFESLVIGVKELTFAANQSEEDEQQALTNKEAILTTVVSLALGIGLFIVLPSFLGTLIFPTRIGLANIAEAVIRLICFVAYIWLISFSKEIQSVFEYHGAEHKSIYAYENDIELTPVNAKKFTTLHPRCGTSFLFIVMFISIIVFASLDFIFTVPEAGLYKFLYKLATRVLCMPIVAGISYELQRYSSCHLNNPFIKLIAWPGLALQKITTKEPSLEKLEVAIVAIKVSLGIAVDNAREVFE